MKEGWMLENIGDICQIVNGGTPKTNVSSYWDGEINWITPADLGKLNTKLVGCTKRKITQIGLEKSSAKLFPPNSIILSTRAPIGHLAINTTPMCTNQGCRGLVPNNNRLDVWYLYYFLWNNVQLLDSLGSGTTFKELSTKALSNVRLPTPPLPEQQRIVSIIDKAFEAIDKAIENTQKNLQNAKDLFESTVRRLFELKGKDWPVIKLGEICKINDGTHFSPKNNSEGKYMYITAKNIKPYFISLKNVTFISEKDHKEIYSRCSPKKGDVLYIKDGATTGIAAINDIDEEFSLLSSVALLKCSDRIINSFLVHYMNSSVGKENFLGYIDGAAITRLTLVKIKNVEINLPPHHEQRLIVDKLDLLRIESEKLQSKYQQKLCDLEELKKSVLNKAFAGEL